MPKPSLLIDFVLKIFTQTDMPVDEQRRRFFIALLVIVIIPTLGTFEVVGLFTKGASVEGGVILMAVLVALLYLLILRYVRNDVVVFRLGLAGSGFILVLLAYELAIGGGNGLAFLWFYFYPLATFFFFGKKEGPILVAISWVIAVVFLIMNFGFYQYDSELGIRFIVTYTIVAILSYGLEYSRNQYYTRLHNEKVSLERAMQQVKILRGLLPICASCKKIRDDEGYWQDVAVYIREHSEVEFSHGICPECASRLYPQYFKRGQSEP